MCDKKTLVTFEIKDANFSYLNIHKRICALKIENRLVSEMVFSFRMNTFSIQVDWKYDGFQECKNDCDMERIPPHFFGFNQPEKAYYICNNRNCQARKIRGDGLIMTPVNYVPASECMERWDLV